MTTYANVLFRAVSTLSSMVILQTWEEDEGIIICSKPQSLNQGTFAMASCFWGDLDTLSGVNGRTHGL